MSGDEKFEYNREQTAKSQAIIHDDAAPAARDIANYLENQGTSQSERKWGVESGALQYKASYEKNLFILSENFLKLEERLQEFVEALAESAKTLEENEQNTEAVQVIIQQTLQPQSGPEYAANKPGPYSYDTSTEVDPLG